MDNVSSRLSRSSLTVAMMQVLARPPNESCNRRVRRDSRYGTCVLPSTSALITRPNVSKLWLMAPASRARLFSAPLRPMLSLPAKSTRFSFPIRISSSPRAPVSFTCTVSVNTQWERLEVWLHKVEATCRRSLPCRSRESPCAALVSGTSSRPCSTTPRPRGSSYMRS